MNAASAPLPRAPYATPADRARALYRIPTAPQRNRTLEICHGREPLLPGQRWPGEAFAVAHATAAGLRQFAPQSFDLVILHRTLDDLAAAAPGEMSIDAQALLDQAAALLVPGGLVAGCFHRRDGLRSIVNRAARWLGRRRPAGQPEAAATWSVAALRRMLARARLGEIKTLSLLPSADAPFKLVDDDRHVARFAYRRELDFRRRHISEMGFQIRRIAVEIGLTRRLEPAVFFWAYKPC